MGQSMPGALKYAYGFIFQDITSVNNDDVGFRTRTLHSPTEQCCAFLANPSLQCTEAEERRADMWSGFKAL